MNLRKHIISVGLILAAWLTPVLSQDYVAVVCAGDTGMTYSVQGWEGSTYNWTVAGGVVTRDYGDSVVINWGDVPGAYEITVQEVSEYGCYGERKSATVLVSAANLELGDDTYICEGEIFTLAPEGDYYSFEWHDGSTGPVFNASQEGLITLKVTDQYGCISEDEMFLEVKRLPYVDLGEEFSLCGEESEILDAGGDGINYLWSTGEISQQITVYQGEQEVWVEVEDAYGCANSDTLMINKCDPSDYFSDIPNAITPSNQDGINDYWKIDKLQAYPDAVVDIFDRWGRLVWRSEPGYPTPWDGRNLNGRDVPMDSYHYIILLNFGDDERVNGTVTVIR
jgi:gliding motility-associated-like protein